MDKRISEIFDYGDEIVVDEEQVDLFDPARIKELTMKKLNQESANTMNGTVMKKARPVWRTGLIAAVVAVLLIGTAFAIYQHTLGDAVLPETTESLHMSLNGFSDSPEYRAYAEWNEWNDAWREANPDPWAAIGEDDSYFEGPANYAWYYQASFTEQVEKLDEILAKYNLTPHTAMCVIDSEEDMCSLLGVEDVFSFEADTLGGYMYDDGSFKAEMIWIGDGETGNYRAGTLFLAVKGSFTQISGLLPADCEEWSYTTADGTEVLLALGRYEPDEPLTGAILAELDGAYVYAGFANVTDKTELEQNADGIAFQTLNERFAQGADTSGIANAVTAKYEAEQAERERDEADFYAPFADKEERDAAVFAELGHYTITNLPEGYEFLYNSAEWKTEILMFARDDKMVDSTSTYGGSTWRGDDSDGVYRFLHLSYQRYFDVNDLETVVNDAEFENVKAYYKAAAGEYTETTVNGYDAILVRDEWGTPDNHLITWFDTDRGLHFTLTDDTFDENGNVEGFTDAELIALAESVAPLEN